jgi:hypothetical protein
MNESEIIERYNEGKPNSLQERILFAVMNELVGRSGFDHWFYNIEGGTQAEILEELSRIIETELPA